MSCRYAVGNDRCQYESFTQTYEQIATEDAIPTDRVRKAIRYAFLAPDIVRAIVEGRQPVGLTSSYLLHHPLPDDWEKQRVLVAKRCEPASAHFVNGLG